MATSNDMGKEVIAMVVQIVHCAHCDSPDIVKNGHAPNGKQLYRCRACGRQSRENPTPNVTAPQRQAEILRAYQERSSLRGVARTFKVSRNTVTAWIKKR
jgi:transposase-like protein